MPTTRMTEKAAAADTQGGAPYAPSPKTTDLPSHVGGPSGRYALLSLIVTAAVILVALLSAATHHFALPLVSPVDAPAEEFSEDRAKLLLQPATRSVRTLGSCDNEVTMPMLLHSFVLQQLLKLSYVPQPRDVGARTPAAEATGAASHAAAGEAAKEEATATPGLAAAGAEMQAVVGRVSYVLLVTHRPRGSAERSTTGETSASTEGVSAAAAERRAAAATRLRRISPPGQVTDTEVCLCGVAQQHHLLLQQTQYHSAAVSAAAATGFDKLLLQQTQQELEPVCSDQQQRQLCEAAVRIAAAEDPFSPSAAAGAVASFEKWEAEPATAAAGAAHPETWGQLECTDSPRVLDAASSSFVTGTFIPKVQCFRVTRHFLAPPSTVSALVGLALKQHEQQQHQQQQQQHKHQQQQQGGGSLAASEAETLERASVDSEQVHSDTVVEGLQHLLRVLPFLAREEVESSFSAAAAAADAAAAAGSGILHHLMGSILAVDAGFWRGAAGGFALDYGGLRTALYGGPANFTLEIKPLRFSAGGSCAVSRTPQASNASYLLGAQSHPKCSLGDPNDNAHAGADLQGNHTTAGRTTVAGPGAAADSAAALMLAAHYDSAPSSPGISDDLGMCAVALEVARAAVYRHLRTANRRQLTLWGLQKDLQQTHVDESLAAPLIVNLNGAEEVMLLAAHAFGSQHPSARRVRVAVNLEASGSRGGSFLLQMPRPLARKLLEAIAALPSPNALSLASDVWNSGQFPGETDFRVWAEVLGVEGGLDLAWIGEGSTYHTSRDDLNNLHKGSLQHTGNTVLLLLQQLLNATAELTEPSPEAQEQDAPEIPFYQDFLGMVLLVLPWEAFSPLAAVACVMLVLNYKLYQSVLGVQTSLALVTLSCLAFGCSCLAAAAAACGCSALGALLLQLYGQLYVHWPLAAAIRGFLAFGALTWCWDTIFFRKLSRRFAFRNDPLICMHAAGQAPLLFLLFLCVVLHKLHFFASFYLLLLLLGLVGPRVVLLLFWHMRNNSSSTECSSRGWSRAQTLRTLSGRGCLLQLVDALGGFIPCVFLFQAHLALLDGTSGPAGRMGESLLQTDLLLNFGVLLPVLVLLPAVLCPSIFHVLHWFRGGPCRPKASAASSCVQETCWRGRGIWAVAAALAAAAAVAAAGLNSSPVFPPLVDLPVPQQLLHGTEGPAAAETTDIRHTGGAVGQLPRPSGDSLAFMRQIHRQPKPHRSLLGLLPFGLPHYLLPSEEFPFSPERPLQVHFVIFRRSKVTAFSSLCSSSSRNNSGNPDKVLGGSCNEKTEQLNQQAWLATTPSEAPTPAESAACLAPELEPFSQMHHVPPLSRHSTQGVAVMGLGPQVFWNPAFADAPLVISAMRRAVVAAEEEATTASSFASLSGTQQAYYSHHTANARFQKHINGAAEANSANCAGQEGAHAESGEDVVASTRRNKHSGSDENEASRYWTGKAAPAFLLVEESPSEKAPLTLAHLHRLSTNRMHWSLYTNAQAFLPPPRPTLTSGVFSPALRGKVDVHYDEATEETRLTLLIGGASLLAVALPASGLKRWNLERQAPLKRLKQCDCYMVTLAAPKPPVMTKLEFFFHGNVPVRFTTRSGLCDITAPNTDCAKTPFFSAFQSFLVGFPHRQAMDEGPLTVESAARGVEAGGGILYSGETSEAKSPNSRFDSFWNRLINGCTGPW